MMMHENTSKDEDMEQETDVEDKYKKGDEDDSEENDVKRAKTLHTDDNRQRRMTVSITKTTKKIT